MWTAPNCSQQLSFQCRTHRRATGSICFAAVDCEAVLARRLEKWPHLLKDVDGEVLAWLRSRDADDHDTVDISGWRHAQFLMADLVRQGRCTVECAACGRSYAASEITCEDWNVTIPALRRGRSGQLVQCPAGHHLLEIVTSM